MTRPQQASAVESSRLLKTTLRKAFPSTSFRIRMSRGTGYGSLHVRWTDGPSRARVEAIAKQFEGKSFDGMDDSTHYLHAIMPDGRESGAGYVICERSMSATFARRVLAAIGQYYGAEAPAVVEKTSRFGSWWEIEGGNAAVRQGMGISWQDALYRASSDRTTVEHKS